MSTNKTQITKDFNEKSILVSREFNATLADVWRAYTEPALLDQWWGPAPWRAETKSMNFAPGGYWLYAMVGPEGDKHWGRMNYLAISHHKNFLIEDVFCDENGTINSELPASKGQVTFTNTTTGTRVEFNMVYPTAEALQKIVEMGFAEGITMCFDQLESLLQQNKI
jgi:uncharacterized protein YndB with AHSA1/START domain